MPDERTTGNYRFVPAPRVEAGWLVCRRVQPGDATSLYEAVVASADHLRPWMPWAPGYTPEAAREFVDRHVPQGDDVAVSDASYLACDRAGHVLGGCGLHARLGEDRLEIGYWVDLHHIRRGVATLAAAALTDLAMAVPTLEAVEIHHDQANIASGAVPARLGYQHVATVSDEPQSPGEVGVEWQWRMDRAAWPTSTGARLLAEARAATS